MGSVVVTATRQVARSTDLIADASVIDEAEIRRAGPAATLGELLGRQAGIEFKQDGGPGAASSIFMRGTNSGHVLLLIDGVRYGSATLGSVAWQNLPLAQIERIEIVRGPASALYGSDAIGGVIQIFTKRGQEGLQPWLELSYGSHRTSALSAGIHGGQQGWRYSLQAADKRSDSFSAIGNPANFSWNPDKDGYHRFSSSGNLSYSPSQAHEFGVSFMYSDGWGRYDASYPGPATDDYKMDDKAYSASAYSRNRLADNWTSTLRIGRSVDDSRSLNNGAANSVFKTTQTQYQWQNDIGLPMGTLLLGAERLEQRVDSTTSFTLGKRSIDSLLAGWSAQLGQHQLQFNVRQDHNSQYGNKTTGGAAYGYQFAPEWRASLSWGTAFKAPTFNDLYDPWGGNPNLKPERAENRELALRYETAAQQTAVIYYDNEIKDLIQWVALDPLDPWSPWRPSNVASARIKGWTLSHAGQNAQGYRWSASADLLDPRDTILDKTLIYRARKTAKLGLGRDFGRFELGAELQAFGKRHVNALNTQHLAGYALVNLDASVQLQKDWSLFARANNVLDRKYALSQDFGADNYVAPGATLFIGVRYAPK